MFWDFDSFHRRREEMKGKKLFLTMESGIHYLWMLALYAIVCIALSNMISQVFFVIFTIPLLLYGIYYVINKKMVFTDKLSSRALWWVVFGIAAVLMLAFAYQVRVESLSWDWGKVIRSASERVLTGKLKDNIYFARYPNNQFWYSILVLVFSALHKINPEAELEQFYLVSIAMGWLMVCMTIALLHHIAVLIWNRKKAFFVGCMALLCAPLYMWALYAYTDTAGMLLMMVLLYLYLKAYYSEKNWHFAVYIALFGLAAAVTYRIKVTVFILVIAAVIALFFQKFSWKKILTALVLIALTFSLGMTTTKMGINKVIPLEEEFCDQYEFPLTHWIMMSLGYGGYRQEDVDYTESLPTYEEKKQANIKEIKKRLKEKGLKDGLYFFAYNKQVRTWGDSTFAGCQYLSAEPKYPDGFWARVVTNDGDLNWLCVGYTAVYYIAMLIGLVLSAWTGIRRRGQRQPLFVGRLAMLGMTIFMMIWECNSRYLVAFLPLMILLAAEGFVSLRNHVKELQTRKGEQEE